MSKIYKFISNVIMSILMVIVCILLIAFVQLNILNKDYANIFGITYFQVATGSMEPTIKIDDIVFIKLNSTIKENDIITYKCNDDYITHRLIKINDDFLITKGDNNNSEDEPIAKENVIGKVIFRIKDISIWKKVFSDKQVIIPLLITTILFVILIIYNEEKGINIDGKD